MSPWSLILLLLLLLSLALLTGTWLRLRKNDIVIRRQVQEIETQLRGIAAQNQAHDELNREKKQLVSLVSHDMKGPFNRIFALVQLMEMTGNNLNDEQREYLGKMYQIVGDGLNMVRNLVDARKMEGEGFELNPEKLDLCATVQTIVNQYRTTAERKKIAVQFDSPQKIDLTIDRTCFSRILENLLSNAVKFSTEGKHIRVDVSGSREFAEIKVKDEGPGFNKEDQANLYQKFRKLSARPTGGESSTGLGLSIVKRMVDTMGGKITCETQVGAGTTFTIRFPHEIASGAS